MKDLEYPSYGRYYDGDRQYEGLREDEINLAQCDLCGEILIKRQMEYFHEELDEDEERYLGVNETECCKQCKKKLEKMLDNYRIS